MKTKLLYLLTAILIGCTTGPDQISNDERSVSFQTLTKDAYTFRNDNLITVTLRTKEEETAFLIANPPTQKIPEVDYTKDMVIGILAGWRQSVSIRVSIDSIKQSGAMLRVYSHEFHPAGQRMGIGNPVHLVVLEKLPLPVRFEPISVVRENESSN